MARRLRTSLTCPQGILLLACLLVAVLGCGSLGPGRSSLPAGVIATWQGGHIERADYENWRRFHQLDDSEDAVREMAFVLSLAEVSQQRGVADEPGVRLALDAVRRNVLLDALKKHLEASVTLSDAEVDGLLRRHPDAFQRPRRLRLRNIHKTLGKQPDEVRRAMTDLHAQLVDGADFEALAKKESDSQSSHRGGLLGSLDPETLPRQVADVVRDLKPGELTEPIEHGDGISIFLCEGVRDGAIPGEKEVRRKIRQTVLRSLRKAVWAQAWAEMEAQRPRELNAAQQEKWLETWATAVVAARHAVDLGLDRQPETAAAVRWMSLDLLAQRELVRRVDERLKPPTEDELRRQYERQPRKYREQPTFDLAVLQIRDAEITPQDAVALGTDVLRQLDSGELGFATAARRFSKHPSAARGGATGWLPRRTVSSWGPVAIQTVDDLQPGQRSRLLHLKSGLWIVEVRGKRDAVQLTLDEARDMVFRDLRRQHIRALEPAIREEQLARLDGLGLAIVSPPEPKAPPRRMEKVAHP